MAVCLNNQIKYSDQKNLDLNISAFPAIQLIE